MKLTTRVFGLVINIRASGDIPFRVKRRDVCIIHVRVPYPTMNSLLCIPRKLGRPYVESQAVLQRIPHV